MWFRLTKSSRNFIWHDVVFAILFGIVYLIHNFNMLYKRNLESCYKIARFWAGTSQPYNHWNERVSSERPLALRKKAQPSPLWRKILESNHFKDEVEMMVKRLPLSDTSWPGESGCRIGSRIARISYSRPVISADICRAPLEPPAATPTETKPGSRNCPAAILFKLN